MNLAPIVLFVYNRPWHIRQTLEALTANYLANESELIIFADGPKPNANQDDYAKIKEVREIIKEKNWCKTVKIIESAINKGLADSIIYGVTKVINEYGKIIVMEDDLATSPWFLTFMNDALNLYEHESDVISISGYCYPSINIKKSTFFLKGADCWGWATWKRGWDLFEIDGEILLKHIIKNNLLKILDFNGHQNYSGMLIDQINKKNDSWAIRWHASALINNKVTLYPNKSLVQNIGFDNSGTHAGISNVAKIKLCKNKIEIRRLFNISEEITSRQNMIDIFQSVNNKKEVVNINILKYFKQKILDFNIKKRINQWISISPSTRDISLVKFQLKKHGFIKVIRGKYYDDVFYNEYEELKPTYYKLAYHLNSFFKPKSVCDFGCGNAFYLEYFFLKGIAEVCGVESSNKSLSFIEEKLRSKIIIANVDKKVDLPQYDLVISSEVAEHIKAKNADVYINNLTNSSKKYIFFTAAAPGQWGDNHINCRPKKYWIEKITKKGFQCAQEECDSFLNIIKNESPEIFLNMFWIKQNLLIFKKK